MTTQPFWRRHLRRQRMQIAHTLGVYEDVLQRHPELLEYVPLVTVADALQALDCGKEPRNWYSVDEYDEQLSLGSSPTPPPLSFQPYPHDALPEPDTVLVVLKQLRAAMAAWGAAITPTPTDATLTAATGAAIRTNPVLMTLPVQNPRHPRHTRRGDSSNARSRVYTVTYTPSWVVQDDRCGFGRPEDRRIGNTSPKILVNPALWDE